MLIAAFFRPSGLVLRAPSYHFSSTLPFTSRSRLLYSAAFATYRSPEYSTRGSNKETFTGSVTHISRRKVALRRLLSCAKSCTT